jgi:hypothetical protein
VSLDLLDVARVFGEIAKHTPDLKPVFSCATGAEIDLEVPDVHTANTLARLLADIRHVPSTPIYGHGHGGTIAGVPVRILISHRAKRRAA